MKIIVDRKELRETFNKIAKTINPSKTEKIYSYAYIKVQEDYLDVSVTDGKVYTTTKLPLMKIGESGEALWPIAWIRDVAAKATSAAIGISYENNKLTAKSGKTQWRCSTLLLDSFPSLPQMNEVLRHTVNRSSLINSIQEAKRFVPKESFSAGLMQVCIRDQAMWSGNGSVYNCRADKDFGPLDVTIPENSIQLVVSTLQAFDCETVDIGVSKSFCIFHFPEFVISVKRYPYPFPDISGKLNQAQVSNGYSLEVDVSAFRDALSRVASSLESDSRRVTIELKEFINMKITSKNLEAETEDTSVECIWDGKDRVLSFDFIEIKGFLAGLEGRVVLRVGDDLKGSKSVVFIEQNQRKSILGQIR